MDNNMENKEDLELELEIEELENTVVAEIDEEPDLELDEEPELLIPPMVQPVDNVSKPEKTVRKEVGPSVIVPDNNIGSYTEWRDAQKRRSKFVVIACSVVAVLAVVLLIVLLPMVFGDSDKGTDGQQETFGVVAGGESDVTSSDTETQASVEATTEATTEVPTVIDTVAPVITGVKDRTFAIGDVVMYMQGISATDDVDGAVDVTVDKSGVNVNKAGSYKVKYTAVDAAGNSVTQEATFTFKVVVATDATYQDMANQLLSQITDSSMSDGQKLRKIYDYLYANVRYTQQRVPGGTWQQEAAVGLKELLQTGATNGNCVTSASLCMAMLEAAGAQVLWMENGSTSTPHAWVLCNVGTGWYHFDTTVYRGGGKRFMCTEAQLKAWEKQSGFVRYFWDKTAVPATATENYTY